MGLHRFIHARLECPVTAAPSDTVSSTLGPLLEQAPKRVKTLSITLGVFFLLGIVVNLLGPTAFGFNPMCAYVGAVSNGALVLGAAGLFFVANSEKLQPSRLVRLGLLYIVFAAFGISFSEMAQPSGGGLSFVAVLIVLFPLFLNTSHKMTVLAAVGAALMAPLAGLVYGATSGTELSVIQTFGFRYSLNFAAAFLAIVPTSILNQMGRDMTAARRMGSYELTDLIGRGGMGEVWRARHQMLRRPAAVKVIRPEALGAASPDRAHALLHRFEREAQATATLHSQNTIQLYDFGTMDDGSFFYVMELLDGFDLETLVERFGPLEPERVAHLLLQICDSLEDAHRSGLIHRDIKPANIFACRYGHHVDHVKVLDFGLVKSMPSGDKEEMRLTADGATAGTPACMAPEMALGEQPIDARADIYAVGCVAYWLLTGAMVFEASSGMQMVLSHVQQIPEPPSVRTEIAIPKALDDIILACLEKNPNDRPQSASALADALREAKLSEGWTEVRMQRWWQSHAPEEPTQGAPETAGSRAAADDVGLAPTLLGQTA